MRWLPLLLLLVAMPVPAWAYCPLDTFRASLREGRVEAVAEAARLVGEAAACAATDRAWAGRIAALAHASAARRALAAGDAARALAFADAGAAFGRPWQLFAIRGDALRERRDADGSPDWAAVTAAYEAALTDIADTSEEENPVPPGAIERLHGLAQQAAMLATRPVEPSRTRSGAPGGLALPRVRGFTVVAVAQPIHFEFGSDRFTALGAEAAERLFGMLDAEARPAILLVGHTDPVGSDAVNDRLSAQRAQAVRRFLVGRGYDPARIAAEGRGRRDPVAFVEGVTYTEQERHQILRRVELIRR